MKELPYFRFTVQEWQNGDISLESYQLQGLFINICCYYWLKDCSITLALLEKKFFNDVSNIKQLINLGIIKHQIDTDILTINYLNEQFDTLSNIRKDRVEAGSKGGKQKASNAKAKSKQNPSYKDKDKDKDNILFIDFWELYNKKINKPKSESKWNKLSKADKEKIIQTLPLFLSKITDKKYQPYPLSYLNSERWNDEIEDTTIEQKTKIKVRFGQRDEINKIYHVFWDDHVRQFETKELRQAFMNENNMEV